MSEHSVDGATLAGDPIAHAAGAEAREELLEAARAALAWFDRFDAHAPEGLAFGGEGRVRKQLRGAISKVARAEAGAEAPITPDPQDYRTEADYELAWKIHEEERRTGRAMSGREREAFARGLRGRPLDYLAAMMIRGEEDAEK